jgi:hypothetical protein
MLSSTEALREIAIRTMEIVTAEVYARVSHIPMLSHYTSIDAFASILRSREFWFSLIRDTNDTSEAIEGTKLVQAALEEHGPKIFQNYSEFDVPTQFEARRHLVENDTYVLSLCEHGSDDRTDRLVMWQAYGHNGSGLCMVLRKQALLGQTAGGRFPVHWCPIEYEGAAGLGERVRHRLCQIEEVIRINPNGTTVPPHAVGLLIAVCAVVLAIGHKNSAFDHEKEVRFVRSNLLQELAPPAGAGYRIVTRDGKQLKKFVLPLRTYPEFSIDASISTLLDHIVVGPSAEQDDRVRQVRELLDANNLSSVEVRKSQIPYRAVH